MRFTIKVAAELTPVSVKEAKEMLRVDGTAEDKLIKRLIAGATRECEAFTNQTFIRTTFEGKTVAQDTGTYRIFLPKYPVISVTYSATSTEGNPLLLNNGWLDDYFFIQNVPAGAALTVELVAGMADAPDGVPEDIKMAIEQLVAYRYENREATDMPAGVRALLQPHIYYTL